VLRLEYLVACGHKFALISGTYVRPVWFRLHENRLSENQNFQINRCLENLLSKESRVFDNPDYFYWIICSVCEMIYMPLSPVIAHFDRISLPFSILSILLVSEFFYSRIIVIKHTIMIK
jgi:hypothetical protein